MFLFFVMVVVCSKSSGSDNFLIAKFVERYVA